MDAPDSSRNNNSIRSQTTQSIINELELNPEISSETIRILKAEQITDRHFLSLTKEELIEMNIVFGQRKEILSFIEAYTNGAHTADDSMSSVLSVDADQSMSEIVNPTRRELLDILQRDKKCLKVVNVLDNNRIPGENGLHQMNRTLSRHFFADINYPTPAQRKELAAKYIEGFPQLAALRVSPDAPKESYFFWEHGGGDKGTHTGILYTHTRNETRYIPVNQRKVKLSPKPIPVQEPVHLLETASKLSMMRANGNNKQAIQDGLAKCHDLYLYIFQLPALERIDRIITTFPHILSYKGLLIHQLFRQVHGDPQTARDMETVLAAGNLLDNRSFHAVVNTHLRGALRIMKVLGHRGITVKKDAASDNPEITCAAPLIKWVQKNNEQSVAELIDHHVDNDQHGLPHIVCVAGELKEGDYYSIVSGYTVHCGPSFSNALEVLVKLMCILGVKVPPLMKKFFDFLCVHVFTTEKQSKYASVNKLDARMAEGLGQQNETED